MIDIERKDIAEFEQAAKKEGLLFNDKATYRAIKINNAIAGFIGLLRYKNKAISKTLYVLPEYRQQGLGKTLILDQLANISTPLEANCTPLSLNIYLSCGGKIVKRYENNITKVVIQK